MTIGFSSIEAAAGLVTDGDPNDKAQLAALWQNQKKPILLGALDTAKAVIVEEVKHSRTETYLVGFVDEVRAELEAGNLLKAA